MQNEDKFHIHIIVKYQLQILDQYFFLELSSILLRRGVKARPHPRVSEGALAFGSIGCPCVNAGLRCVFVGVAEGVCLFEGVCLWVLCLCLCSGKLTLHGVKASPALGCLTLQFHRSFAWSGCLDTNVGVSMSVACVLCVYFCFFFFVFLFIVLDQYECDAFECLSL